MIHVACLILFAASPTSRPSLQFSDATLVSVQKRQLMAEYAEAEKTWRERRNSETDPLEKAKYTAMSMLDRCRIAYKFGQKKTACDRFISACSILNVAKSSGTEVSRSFVDAIYSTNSEFVGVIPQPKNNSSLADCLLLLQATPYEKWKKDDEDRQRKDREWKASPQYKKLQQWDAAVKANGGKPPILDITNLKVGSIGTLKHNNSGSHPFSPPLWIPVDVFQVVDAENVLVRGCYMEGGSISNGAIRRGAGPSYTDPVWVKGVPTAGMVDGETAKLPQKMMVTGTRQYKTSLGTSKTVYVVEPLDRPASTQPNR